MPLQADAIGERGEDHASEWGELHFLAALVDELMIALHQTGALSRERLQGIEDAVSRRTGTPPRAW